jgi:hypothetical protein
MRASFRSTTSILLLSGYFATGLAQAQIPHHRILQTLSPLQEEFSNGAAGPPDAIRFGAAVAIRNQTALVGMPEQRDGGRVAVFVRSPSGLWNRAATLKVAGESRFGSAIAFRDNTAIIGSPTAAYVYKLMNGVWQRTDRLAPPSADNVTSFATDIAYQDGIAVIGASRHNAPGAAYVFRLSTAGKRVGMQRLQSSDGHANDGFGVDVSMTFDTIVAGAPQQVHPASNTPAGAAYVFRRSNTTWRQTQKLMSTELDPGDRFGTSVAIDRGMILVGAPSVDRFDGRVEPPYNDIVESGAVYGFVPSGSVYAEALKIRPTNASFDNFGNEIVMFDRFIAVGAEEPHDPSGATIAASSAWTYDRSGNNVTLRARTPSGYFQSSLALANNWLLSGTQIDADRCGPGCIGQAILIDMNYVE